MATMEQVKTRAKEKEEGLIGLLMGFLDSFDRLDISADQWMRFFKATLSGEQLWLAFTARRDAEDTPEDYIFRDYVQEVLADVTAELRKPLDELTLDEATPIVTEIVRTSRSAGEIRERLTEAGFNGDDAAISPSYVCGDGSVVTVYRHDGDVINV